MKARRLFFAALGVTLLGAQIAFGWGNATHAYFAKQLGAKFGPPNLNEIYGAVLPDCFLPGLSPWGQPMYDQTHDYAVKFLQAANGHFKKPVAVGFMSHNQSWGADYTAHTKSFTFPDFAGGYAVEKGVELMPQLVPVLKQILLATEMLDDGTAEMFATGIAPELGHDLSETAVDLLVRRNYDRFIGGRLMLAAQLRPAFAGELLAEAYGADLAGVSGMTLAEATAYIIQAEKEYRQQIIQYGMAFCLPENQTIAMLSQQMAPVAEIYIETALEQNIGIPIDVTVAPEQVKQFINAALTIVKADYAFEISRTLCFVEKGMRANGIYGGWPFFAKSAGEETEESVEATVAPTAFSIAQNSPNPFNPTTQICYQLPAASKVRLVVYDMLGREVAVLVDAEQNQGSYSVRFDARGYASGVYLYRVEAGPFVETRRMVLTR